jgi:Raf kinase inhibitor-like YbhB/YbcL family protein
MMWFKRCFLILVSVVGLAVLACTPAQTPGVSRAETDSCCAPAQTASNQPAQMDSCCAPAPASKASLETGVNITLTSGAFTDGGKIPVKYTCEGQGISFPLTWTGISEGAKSLVLIMEDLDASRGILTHWTVFNIPPKTGGLPENVPAQEHSSSPFIQGSNTFGKSAYQGPCPPEGQSHRYRLTLYSLDTMLPQLNASATKDQILGAIQGHILGTAQLTGLYK